LQDLDFLGPALEYVHCHHERPDGKGYPRHLKAEQIPLGARILAVADAFDAMTTDRPYQKGKRPEVALDILKKGAGEKWDDPCVSAFDAVLKGETPESETTEHQNN
jgi:HD-GYP domain-containing protein (c-di-GMP phosphodiesterase class II)